MTQRCVSNAIAPEWRLWRQDYERGWLLEESGSTSRMVLEADAAIGEESGLERWRLPDIAEGDSGEGEADHQVENYLSYLKETGSFNKMKAA